MHCSQIDNVEFGIFVCTEDKFACIGFLLNCSDVDVYLIRHRVYAGHNLCPSYVRFGP